jgi:hypothetical protein
MPEQRPAGSPVKFVENLFRCVDERFDYLDDVLWSTKRDQKIVVKVKIEFKDWEMRSASDTKSTVCVH